MRVASIHRCHAQRMRGIEHAAASRLKR